MIIQVKLNVLPDLTIPSKYYDGNACILRFPPPPLSSSSSCTVCYGNRRVSLVVVSAGEKDQGAQSRTAKTSCLAALTAPA